MSAHIVITPAAAALLGQLKERYGALLFHQSGGCCSGSAPVCLRQGEFRVGSRDVLFGVIEDTPFYLGAAQFEYLSEAQLILDVVEAESDSFSLESSDGVRFITRTACPSSSSQLGRAGPGSASP